MKLVVDVTDDDRQRATEIVGYAGPNERVAHEFAVVRTEAQADLEARIRDLIVRIESINTYQPDGASRTHWFNCGMDEAYDNVLDWLYRDVLGEER